MIERAQWIERQRGGIGGSEAAAVLGLDPWRSPLDVWRAKVENVPPTEDEVFLFRLGHLLEPVIAGLYTARTGLAIYETGVFQHSKYPEIIGSPDRISPGDRVVELTSEHQFADKFGDPDETGTSDIVPDHYLFQGAHYMAITDLDRCDVAVLHGGYKFAIYRLRRDLDLEKAMLDQLRAFWHDYVLKRIPPPIDSSIAWTEYLAKMYPANRGEIVEVDPKEHVELMRHVHNCFNYADQIEVFTARLNEAKNRVKAFIGERDGIVGPWGKITWKLCRDTMSTTINFDHVLHELGQRYQIPEREIVELREAHMQSEVVKKGVRRFVPKRDPNPAVPDEPETAA